MKAIVEPAPSGLARVLPLLVPSCLGADLSFANDAALKGAVVSVCLAGAAAGSFVGGLTADKLGRRLALVCSAAPLILGSALAAVATSPGLLIAGRVAAGVGIGMTSAIAPVFITEVAPTAVRGQLGSLNQLCICFGILVIVVAGAPAAANLGYWRLLFWWSAVPAALMAIFALAGPESPRWLLRAGRSTAAADAAGRLWGPAGVAALAAEAESKLDGQGGATWAELLGPKGRRPLILGGALFMIQQLSGINAIVYFSSTVFAAAGVSSAALASAAVAATNVIGTIAAGAAIESAGRKTLLQASFAGMGACMALLSAGLALPALRPVSGTIAVGATLGYVLCFALGAGPVPALLAAELAPERFRGRALASAMLSHWTFNFLLGSTFLAATSAVGVPVVYAAFATVSAVAVVFVTVCIPETKGRSANEIEALMGGGGS